MIPAAEECLRAHTLAAGVGVWFTHYSFKRFLEVFLPVVPQLINLEGPSHGRNFLRIGTTQRGITYFLNADGILLHLDEGDIWVSSEGDFLAYFGLRKFCNRMAELLNQHSTDLSDLDEVFRKLKTIHQDMSRIYQFLMRGEETTIPALNVQGPVAGLV